MCISVRIDCLFWVCLCRLYVCIKCLLYIYIVNWLTGVKGDPKAPFSIATTPKCKGGRKSFPWIAPLYP